MTDENEYDNNVKGCIVGHCFSNLIGKDRILYYLPKNKKERKLLLEALNLSTTTLCDSNFICDLHLTWKDCHHSIPLQLKQLDDTIIYSNCNIEEKPLHIFDYNEGNILNIKTEPDSEDDHNDDHMDADEIKLKEKEKNKNIEPDSNDNNGNHVNKDEVKLKNEEQNIHQHTTSDYNADVKCVICMKRLAELEECKVSLNDLEEKLTLAAEETIKLKSIHEKLATVQRSYKRKIRDLRSKRSITNHLIDNLKYASKHSKILAKIMLEKKENFTQYEKILIQRIYYESPKAYEYMRNIMEIDLPSESLIKSLGEIEFILPKS